MKLQPIPWFTFMHVFLYPLRRARLDLLSMFVLTLVAITEGRSELHRRWGLWVDCRVCTQLACSVGLIRMFPLPFSPECCMQILLSVASTLGLLWLFLFWLWITRHLPRDLYRDWIIWCNKCVTSLPRTGICITFNSYANGVASPIWANTLGKPRSGLVN